MNKGERKGMREGEEMKYKCKLKGISVIKERG